MPSAARVSVILPCRNAAATLDQAIASIANQTVRDLEIIAVNNGSTDGTAAVLSAWAARDSRIRRVEVEAVGLVNALNIGISHARGDILARMDADDVAEPARLSEQLTFLEAHSDIAACGTGVEYFPRQKLRAGARRYERWINSVVTPAEIERDLFVECPIPHPTLVLRRDAFDDVGGYRDMGWPEDYDLVLRLWKAGHRLGKVPDVLLHWRDGPNRLSRTDPRYSEDAFRRCKVHHMAPRVDGRRVVVWGAGPVGKAFSLAARQRGHTIAAFVDLDPRKIGQTIHAASVIHPSDIGSYRDTYVVAAVGNPGARADIRRELKAAGFREPLECCAVA